jgi:hypothetical protein
MIFIKKTTLKLKSTIINRNFYEIDESDNTTSTKIKMYINLYNKHCQIENQISITKLPFKQKEKQ